MPERVLGRRSTTTAVLNEGDRADALAHEGHRLRHDFRRGLLAARVEDQEAEGGLPLEGIVHPPRRRTPRHPGGRPRTSSIAPVERRCPATLMMSSVRDMTKT